MGIPRERDWCLRPPDDGQLSDGEAIVLYLACSYERYWAEGIRTLVARGTGLAPVQAFDDVYAKAVEGIEPGRKVSAIAEDVACLLAKAAITPIDHYGIGEGIGLSPDEAPQLSLNDSTVLREGMCITFRIAACEVKERAYMIGNTFIVGHGCL